MASGTFPPFRKRTPIANFDVVDTLLSKHFFFDGAKNLERKKLLIRDAYHEIMGYLSTYEDGRLFYENMVVGCITSYFRGLHGQLVDDVKTELEAFSRDHLTSYLYRTSEEIFSTVARRYNTNLAVSGLPQEFAHAIKPTFPFTHIVASECSIDNGKYDALYTDEEVRNDMPKRSPKIRPMVGSAEKVRAVYNHDLKEPIDYERSWAGANGWQDVLALQLFPHPLLFNVTHKEKLRALARKNKWKTVDADSEDPEKNINVVRATLEELGVA